jgi:hypothetical protein
MVAFLWVHVGTLLVSSSSVGTGIEIGIELVPLGTEHCCLVGTARFGL